MATARVLAPRLVGVAFLAAMYVMVLEQLEQLTDGADFLSALLGSYPLETRVLLKVAPIASLAWQAHTIGGLPETRAAGLRSYAVNVGAGLGLSLVGDALLQIDDLQPPVKGADLSAYFLCGIASFLAAHAVYIVAFRSRGVPRAVNVPVGALCGGAAAALFAVLYPALPPGVLVPAVAIYAAAVSFMCYSAAVMGGGDATSRALALGGALLFMLSDAVLAARQLGPPWLQAAVRPWHPQTVVMVTYYGAQALIASSIRVPAAAAAAAAAGAAAAAPLGAAPAGGADASSGAAPAGSGAAPDAAAAAPISGATKRRRAAKA